MPKKEGRKERQLQKGPFEGEREGHFLPAPPCLLSSKRALPPVQLPHQTLGSRRDSEEQQGPPQWCGTSSDSTQGRQSQGRPVPASGVKPEGPAEARGCKPESAKPRDPESIHTRGLVRKILVKCHLHLGPPSLKCHSQPLYSHLLVACCTVYSSFLFIVCFPLM